MVASKTVDIGEKEAFNIVQPWDTIGYPIFWQPRFAEILQTSSAELTVP